MGFSGNRPPKDSRHTGGTGGVLGGYTPELGSIAQAKYATQLDGEAAAGKPGRLARIRRLLRRLLWEF